MSTPGSFMRRSAGEMIALLEEQQRPLRRELQTSSEAQTRIRQKVPHRACAKRAAEWHVRSMCMHLQSSMAASCLGALPAQQRQRPVQVEAIQPAACAQTASAHSWVSWMPEDAPDTPYAAPALASIVAALLSQRAA